MADDNLGYAAAFDAAIQTVTKIRGETYGHPLNDFELAHRLKEPLRACRDPVVRHALEMICVKMARITHAPDNVHLDSVIDIAGYARTIAMIWDERVEREKERAYGEQRETR